MPLPRIFALPALAWLARFSFLRRLVPQTGSDALDPSIYGFILHYSRREQIYWLSLLYFLFRFFISLGKYRSISSTLLLEPRPPKSSSVWTLRKSRIFSCSVEPSWLLS